MANKTSIPCAWATASTAPRWGSRRVFNEFHDHMSSWVVWSACSTPTDSTVFAVASASRAPRTGARCSSEGAGREPAAEGAVGDQVGRFVQHRVRLEEHAQPVRVPIGTGQLGEDVDVTGIGHDPGLQHRREPGQRSHAVATHDRFVVVIAEPGTEVARMASHAGEQRVQRDEVAVTETGRE